MSDIKEFVGQILPDFNHNAITDECLLSLSRFTEGKKRHMFLDMPFLSGKTSLCSICLPLFLLKRNPTLRIGVFTFDYNQSAMVSRFAKKIIESDSFFNNEKGINCITAPQRGSVRFFSAFDAISCGYPFDVVIFDSMYKDMSNVNNYRRDAKLISWFDNKIMPQMSKNGKILSVSTKMKHWDFADFVEAELNPKYRRPKAQYYTEALQSHFL